MNSLPPVLQAVQPVPPLINPPVAARRSRIRFRYVVLALVVALPVLAAWGITGYVRSSGDTAALANSVSGSLPGQWHKRLAINVGGLTLALVREVAGFTPLPPEAKLGLESARSADVAIYDRLGSAGQTADGLFASADAAMKRRGWQRLTGVKQGQDLVLVYVPRKQDSTREFKCCVAVVHECQLVVACARVKTKPLITLAERQVQREMRPLWRSHLSPSPDFVPPAEAPGDSAVRSGRVTTRRESRGAFSRAQRAFRGIITPCALGLAVTSCGESSRSCLGMSSPPSRRLRWRPVA